MTRQFGVDTERLGKVSGDAENLAVRLERIYDNLLSRTQEVGQCWGDDKTGKSFEQNYLANSKDVLTAMREMSSVVRSMRDGVNTMAKGFRRTEANAVDTLAVGLPKTEPSTAPSGGDRVWHRVSGPRS
ncbi:WXG100 family type VII secretion target [Streptoalloteichus hindustanus]|uniref:WXG100 family type VII secretion target n=1 Tax=Streptoalloteichus hindustanus TaxID=2017 RepID=A0A1M5PW22_STRHI|nr:WXG100 family type VII secretion target [Streptoalloteichus hindustanus]SHH05850.1 hypothetical protein SAMN05444320_12017 [Streptoalloteichus hindustanus]